MDDSRAFVEDPGDNNVRVVRQGDTVAAERSTIYDPFRPDGALDSSVAPGGVASAEQSGKLADSNEASAAAALANPLAQPASGTFRRGDSSVQPSGSKAEYSGTFRRSTAGMQSMRRSTMDRKATLGPGGAGTTKRSTLASMMLSTKYTTPGADNFDDAGEQVASEHGSVEEQEQEQEVVGQYEGDEGEGTGGETLAAEQIFMPNMRREAYVPVRIARDKLKQVLKEMAQMKHMHYAALETMERQQEFLKAQLEATVATYARKLTADYNERVKALEAEYKRRLDGMNKTALGDLQVTLAAAQKDAKVMEQRMQAQLFEKEQEIEKERKMFQTKVQMARQAQDDSDKNVEALRNQLSEKDNIIEQLTIDVRVAKASGASGSGGGGANGELIDQLQRQIESLKATVSELKHDKQQLEDEKHSLERAIEERDHEIAQLQDQLASAEGGGGELVVGDDGGDGGEGYEYPVVDEGGEEETEGVVIGGEDDEEPQSVQY